MTSIANPRAANVDTRHGLKRGFSTPTKFRSDLRDAHETSLFKSLGAAGSDHVLIISSILTAGLVSKRNMFTRMSSACALSILCARGFRGLENLVHEASHFNWSRDRKKVNDGLSTALAALPSGVRLSTYRSEHLLHHGKFGSESDPDFIRYKDLKLDDLDRSNQVVFLREVCKRFIRYQRGWFRTSAGELVRSLVFPLLYAVALTAPLARWRGTRAMTGGLSCWLLTRLVSLPLLRFIAESSEHRFKGRSTVFESTISNLGLLQRLLIHPHGDGYHTIHHMWPGIPHHKISAVHRLLIGDPGGDYARQLRYRTRVFAFDISKEEKGR